MKNYTLAYALVLAKYPGILSDAPNLYFFEAVAGLLLVSIWELFATNG